MKTILITAYAVNPFKGSEDGTGWNISREIAKKNKVILITRKNNIPHIEKYVATSNDPVLDNMTFYGFDLPKWVMFLKKRIGERGYVLYFYFWQLFIALFIKRKGLKFDIAHSLNFHSDSIPQFLWLLGKPTIWGPIGHHPKVPKGYLLKVYGTKNYLKDRLYYTVKWMMRNLDPFFHLAVFNSERIIGINSAVEKVLFAAKEKVTIIPAVASEQIKELKEKDYTSFNVLSVGRFHYMKGFDITIRAFAKFYHRLHTIQQKNVTLTLVGKGPERDRLIRIAESENINHAIRWIDWVNKENMSEIYQQANTFLFPSHEGAGMVIPEAMSYGLPIACFDNEGPGELVGQTGGILVKYSNYDCSVDEFSKHLNKLFSNNTYQNDLGQKNIAQFKDRFLWSKKGTIIEETYLNTDFKLVNVNLSNK